jgi:2'-5' RNA ligase
MPSIQLSVNQILGKPRHETLGGREYLIAPVVAIRSGVLNGEFVPAEEVEKYPEAWNGRPVPLGHPMVNGDPISANTPDQDEKHAARLWNVIAENGTLKGEIWVDLEKARAIGGDALEVVNRLEAEHPIEVSTAYYRDLEPKSGKLNGARYSGIARNLRPDHLAILLYEVGACSWKDGCGTPRVNMKTNATHTGVMVALYPSAETAAALALDAGAAPEGSRVLPASELHLTLAYLGDVEDITRMSQGDLMRMIAEFAPKNPVIRGWVDGLARFNTEWEGFNPVVLLYDCDYLMWMRNWLMDWLPAQSAHGFIPHITLAYVPVESATPDVRPERREVIFDRIGVAWGDQVTLFPLAGEAVAVANHGSSLGEMAKSALKALQAFLGIQKNGQAGGPETPATNSDEEVGMAKKELIEKLVANSRCPFDQADLESMSEPALNKLAAALECGCGDKSQPQANAETPVDREDGLKALADAVAALRAEVSTIKANQAVVENDEKARWVGEISANERSTFSKAELDAMDVPTLRKLASSLRPADYSGRGAPKGNAADEAQVPPPPPVLLAKAE